jgi:membrane-associated phospholipid phosphatase
VVIVTANHYWIDVALGWMVAAAAAVVALRLARLRPESWGWRWTPREAEA